MIAKTLKLGTKGILLSLLTISAIGVTSLPARGDDAVVQDSYQETLQTGEGNVSVQESRQESRVDRNVEHRGRGYRSDVENNTGVVQTNTQYCDQYGESNVCAQNTEQRSNIRSQETRHGTGNRGHHRGRY